MESKPDKSGTSSLPTEQSTPAHAFSHERLSELIRQGAIRVMDTSTEIWLTDPNPVKGLVQKFEIVTGGTGVHKFWVGPNPDSTGEYWIYASEPSASLSADALVAAHFNQREVSLKVSRFFFAPGVGPILATQILAVSVQ